MNEPFSLKKRSKEAWLQEPRLFYRRFREDLATEKIYCVIQNPELGTGTARKREVTDVSFCFSRAAGKTKPPARRVVVYCAKGERQS